MVEQYAECQQKIYADGALSYYLGPGCSTDKQRIELRSYDDPSCVVWDGGGLLPRGFTNYFVSNDCTSCSEYNEETGNYEINDLCIRLWQDAAMKCETRMEVVSPTGADNSGCDTFAKWPAAEAKQNAKFTAITLVLATGLLSGLVYVFYKRRTAAHAAANPLLSDGVMT